MLGSPRFCSATARTASRCATSSRTSEACAAARRAAQKPGRPAQGEVEKRGTGAGGGRARGAEARGQDEQRHEQAAPAVNPQLRPVPDEHGGEHHGRGDAVAQAVRRRGAHGGGIDLRADAAVVKGHVELDKDRRHEDAGRQRAERHRLRRGDLLDGAGEQFKAHQQDGQRHDEARDVLDAAVAERVLRVRLAAGHAEADERDERGTGVGMGVDRIRRHGDGAGERTGKELAEEQQRVERDAHRAAQRAVRAAHAGRVQRAAGGDEPFGQQTDH